MNGWRTAIVLLPALVCCSCARGTVPDAATLRLARTADAHYHLGKLDIAKKQYEQIVRAHPGNVVAHIRLGAIAYHKGDLAGARQHFELAARRDPGSPQAKYNLAMLSLNDAHRLLNDYLSLAPAASPAHEKVRALQDHLREFAAANLQPKAKPSGDP